MEEKKEPAGGLPEDERDCGQETSLEDLFGELDGILKSMDDPELSLEDSFALYEKGMEKVRLCNEKLDTVEKRMLVIAQDGGEVPFEE